MASNIQWNSANQLFFFSFSPFFFLFSTFFRAAPFFFLQQQMRQQQHDFSLSVSSFGGSSSNFMRFLDSAAVFEFLDFWKSSSVNMIAALIVFHFWGGSRFSSSNSSTSEGNPSFNSISSTSEFSNFSSFSISSFFISSFSSFFQKHKTLIRSEIENL